MPTRFLTVASTVVCLLASSASLDEGPTARSAEAAPGGAVAVPVVPRHVKLPLAGIDAAALSGASGASPDAQSERLRAEGVAVATLDERPELLSPPTSVARFDAVGVSWDHGRAPASEAIWVRVREQGRWTEWHLLTPADATPEVGSADAAVGEARVTTEPLLTDGADGVQVRVDSAGGVLTGVRAELIDAGRSAADGAAAGQFAAETARLPSGAPARPRIITRAQWGADESLRTGEPDYAATVEVGFVHHTVTTNSYTPAGAYAQVRSIYAFHTLARGWSDIGYNVLVDRYGQVFEGRAGGLDRAVIGAATGGLNRSTVAVSALGNFDEAGSTGAMLESISRLLAWKLAIHFVHPTGTSQLTNAGADTSRYPPGHVVTVRNIGGHRDTNVTACPGAHLYGALDDIRQRVLALTRAGLYQPAVTTTPRTPAANGSARITAGLLYGGSWAVRVYDSNGFLLSQSTGIGWSIDVRWPMTDLAGRAVPEGTYRVVVESYQNGTAALPFVGGISTSGAFGNFESLTLTPGGALVRGWASVTNGDEATVAFEVDGVVRARVPADAPRPDVERAHPALGPNRGFSTTLTTTVGPHLICAWGERTGLLRNLIGCRRFSYPRAEPFGHVERVFAMDAGLRVAGWAIDRDTTGPVWVRFYVDGRYAGDPGAIRPRPDVAAVYPAYGPNHGFDVAVNTGPGTHVVCVNGLNRGAGSREGFLRCVVGTTTAGPPKGHLDRIETGSRSLTVSGWSFDPDTTAPIAIHAYVDGRFAGAFPSNRSRPDLSRAFPFVGTAHGFRATVRVTTAGRHSVCVYAVNAGSPAPNPLLGCGRVN